ncbi:MAG: hypothetical protein H7A43_02175 [Verrucomicrobia bacterium]|nr:hypothetical protein [Kiritimatiellia bacterium]MCP5487429.1 hypothetical protein [Verrucomicrobiota bacterium]
MYRYKILLLPFAALAELIALAVCWVIALLADMDKADRSMRWAMSIFPDREWYFRP